MNLPKIFKKYQSLRNLKIIIINKTNKQIDGNFDPNTFTINIYANSAKVSNQTDTIYHELSHAIMYKRSKGKTYLNHTPAFYRLMAELVSI